MAAFNPRILSDDHLLGRAGAIRYLSGKDHFAADRVDLLSRGADTASFLVFDPNAHSVVLFPSNGHLSGTCTCPIAAGNRFCEHMVAAGLFLRGRIEAAGGDWSEPLGKALAGLKKARPDARPPHSFLLFSLVREYGNWTLRPHTLDASKILEVTGRGIDDIEPRTIYELIRQNPWLGSQAKPVRRAVSPSDFLNGSPAIVSVANVIRRSEEFGRGSQYYGYTRPIEDYLDLLASSGGQVFSGDTSNPLVVPLALHPDSAEFRLHIERGARGEVVLSARAALPGKMIRLDADVPVRISSAPLWVRVGNDLLRFSNSVDSNAISPFLAHPAITIPDDRETEFLESYLVPLADAFRIEGEQITWEDVYEPPVKRLLLTEVEGRLVVQLRFGYGEVEVPYDENAPRMATRHKRDGTWTLQCVHRDLAAEGEIHGSISGARSGLKHIRNEEIPSAFCLRATVDVIDFLLKKIPALIADGFEIYGEEALASARVNRNEPTIMLSVSSGIDWFDLSAVVRFGDVEASLKEVRRALRKRKKYVKLADGTIGELPEAWVDRYKHLFGLGEQTENGVRLTRQQITLVDDLLQKADQTGVDVGYERSLDRLRSFNGIAGTPLPSGFRGELRPYQKAGYDWLHFLSAYGFGGCLADDMGLGKTVQALVFLQSQHENGAAGRASLIVMPRSLLFNWQREAEKFTPGLRILEHFGQGRDGDTSRFSRYDLVITTYGTMRRDIQLLRSYPFRYAILDESQAIKNPNSQVSKAVRLLDAEHRLVMTGTPVENSTTELWSQFAFLNPGMLGGLEYFKKEFANPIERRDDEEAAQLLRRLVYPFILRRTKDQVAPELPPRTERIVYAEMEPAQRKQYTRMRDYYRGIVLGMIEDDGIDDARMKILEGLLRLRQISNHPVLVDPDFKGKSAKMSLLLEHLNTLHAEGHKALVFSQFVQMLTLIRKELDAARIPYVYLDGRTTDRKSVVDRFQSDPDIPFFLISLKAGGVGLNLTAADYVIHVDPWWNPAVETQAADRTHRIGQEKPVFVYKLITRDTVEEKILRLQEHKKALVEQLITTETSIFKDLTKEGVRELFS
ncbi:MAG TPA: DEAD/DEAH box helicase [Anaerolineales bacterium]|nr:DEAD/DEAH box helicase [Anaerolineales bacterium]